MTDHPGSKNGRLPGNEAGHSGVDLLRTPCRFFIPQTFKIWHNDYTKKERNFLFRTFHEGAAMRGIGNFIWFIFGGVFMGLAWWGIGLLAYVSIIGIPWGKSCFVIGQFSFFPFGREAISRKELKQEDDIGTGALGTLGNVIWFIVAGVWLALGHLFCALANFISVLGIPFGIQHLKLAGIALAPIGKTIVPKELAEAARKANAETYLTTLRR